MDIEIPIPQKLTIKRVPHDSDQDQVAVTLVLLRIYMQKLILDDDWMTQFFEKTNPSSATLDLRDSIQKYRNPNGMTKGLRTEKTRMTWITSM